MIRWMKWLLYGLLLQFCLSVLITKSLFWNYNFPSYKKLLYTNRTRIFTAEELKSFNGTDKLSPIYISIQGQVFDVSAGYHFYGPGKSYGVFAGRDASRAFVTGCFQDPAHLSPDIRGLNKEQLQVLIRWKQFFENHPNYYQVGILVDINIDPMSPIPKDCNEHRPQPHFAKS